MVLYTQNSDTYGGFQWVDALAAEAEASHALTFRAKPKLFFFGDATSYARRSSSKARARTFPNGAIAVSPWVQREDADGTLSLRVYLAHELSHALLYQNMSTLQKLRFPRWLLEGVATHTARQMGTPLYPTKEETYALIRDGNWMPPSYFETDKEDSIRLEVENRKPFIYCEFACIVDDLIARFGRQKFQTYLERMLREDDHDAVFRQVFGVGFDAYLADFQERIGRSGTT